MGLKSNFASTGVLLALLVMVALVAAKRRDRANAAAAALTATAANLQSNADRLEQAIVVANAEHDRLAATLKSRALAHNKGNRPPPSHPTLGALIQRNPHLQALYLAAQRAHLDQTYGPLFRTIHLSADQIAKFKDIMNDHDGQILDLEATAASQGLPTSDPAIVAFRQQADQQLQAAETILLGDSGYQQLQDYNRSLPVRTLVDNIAGTLAFTAPLSAQQAEQLTQALAEASPSYQTGGNADWEAVDYAQVDQKAAAFLTAAQLATWEQAEPMGGGASRWRAPLDHLLKQALPPEGEPAKTP